MESVSGRKIKTIVVLVQENRSFDHMLGWFKRLNPKIDGLTGTESNPLSTSNPGTGIAVPVTDTAEYVDPDPGHSIGAIHVFGQVFGEKTTIDYPDKAPMNGFAQQAESIRQGLSKRVMSAFEPNKLPAYQTLVTEFGICDRWFASVPASTQPNRLFVHSATSSGAVSNKTMDLVAGLPQKTIFESVEASGLNWGIYFQDIPATLFFRNLRSVSNLAKFHPFADFEKHAKEGKLPNYVVIEQRFFDTTRAPANDDHPPHNVAIGQQFIAEVYEMLRSSPQWDELLWIITYDEHGGYYDHVPTPLKNVPSPDGLESRLEGTKFNFDRLGVRVPAIFISPWIDKGTILHQPNGPTPDSQFEHSSIPATVKKLLNLRDPFLTKRDAWAATFEGIISSRQEPRTDCPRTLPIPPGRVVPANDKTNLTEFQGELLELASKLFGAFSKVDAKCLSCFGMSKKDHVTDMKVKAASDYCQNAVCCMVEAGLAASETEANQHKIVQLLSGTLPGKPKYRLIDP